jgi:hypothetical protein
MLNINGLSSNVAMSKFKHLTIDRHYISIHKKPHADYDIPISDARNSSEICSWLGQIAEKNWCTFEMLGELVIAFSVVNGDLRGIKCCRHMSSVGQ